MGIVKKVGSPTRTTKGSIGDIYIDLNNGNEYQCTFAYKSAGMDECDWKLIKKGSGIKEVIEKAVPNIETSAVIGPVVEETKDEIVETEVVVEKSPTQQTKRTDYASYSRSKNKNKK